MDSVNATCNCKGGRRKDDLKQDLLKVIEEQKDIPGSLIAVLHKAQEMYGYLPKDTLYLISKGLRIPISEVMGIVTFYSFFSTVPKGKYEVMVCMGTACYVKGADRVLEAFKKQLDIDVGGTTGDKLFSLTASRCIGACGLAPVISVGHTIHREVNDKQVEGIISDYRERESKGGSN